MPDGTKWAFAYDAYGNITTMNLPTGGVITYEWDRDTTPLLPGRQHDGGKPGGLQTQGK